MKWIVFFLCCCGAVAHANHLINIEPYKGEILNRTASRKVVISFAWDCRKSTLSHHDDDCGSDHFPLPKTRKNFTFPAFKRDPFRGVPSSKRRYYGSLQALIPGILKPTPMQEAFRLGAIGLYQIPACCGRAYQAKQRFQFSEMQAQLDQLTVFQLRPVDLQWSAVFLESIPHHGFSVERGIALSPGSDLINSVTSRFYRKEKQTSLFLDFASVLTRGKVEQNVFEVILLHQGYNNPILRLELPFNARHGNTPVRVRDMQEVF